MSLFGHHHAAHATLGSRLADLAASVLHLPLEVWIAALPIAGGLVVAYVTYRLNLRRDRLALRDEAQRRRAEDERVRARVYAELASRLGRYRTALRDAGRGGAIARVAAEHEALLARAGQADVIDALGERYVPFMALLGSEEATLAQLTAHGEHGKTTLAGDVDRGAALGSIDSALAGYAELFARPGGTR